MSGITMRREKAVGQLINEANEVLKAGTLDRYVLSQIQLELQLLASKTELWTTDDFPEPNEDERQNRFLIHSEDEEGFSLYLNVMRPGKKIPPHDHTTWACVAAVIGAEMNTLYDRLDDGRVEGVAEISAREVIELSPGSSVSLMPDDIHSVEIQGTDIIRHLHFYGQPLESLTKRKVFDQETGTYRIMDVGVKTKSGDTKAA